MGKVAGVRSVCFCGTKVRERTKETSTESTYGKEFPGPILCPFARRSFFGTERFDTPSSEVMPSSRRPRKSSPNISVNPPMTKGLSSPSTSSPKSASSSMRPLSVVWVTNYERVNAGDDGAGLTISWYALSNFLPSSDNLPPYLTTSS